MPNTHPKSVGGPYPHIFNPKGADCTTDCSACRSPPPQTAHGPRVKNRCGGRCIFQRISSRKTSILEK